VTITATEPGTGRIITVHANRDQARWNPRAAVVFAGAAGEAGCSSAGRRCGDINFFTHAPSPRARGAGHPQTPPPRTLRPGGLRWGTGAEGGGGGGAGTGGGWGGRGGPPREGQARTSTPVSAGPSPRPSRERGAGGRATRRNGLLAGLTGQVIDIGAGYRDI